MRNIYSIPFKKLSLEIDKLSNPILEPNDLTHSQFKILKYLLTHPYETVRQADKVHPIHTVELEYFLIYRRIETSIIPAAEELGIMVLTYCRRRTCRRIFP